MPEIQNSLLPFKRCPLSTEQVVRLENPELSGQKNLRIWENVWQINTEFAPADEQGSGLPHPLNTITYLARLIIPTSSEYNKLLIPHELEENGVLAFGSLLLPRYDIDVAAPRLVRELNGQLASLRSPYRL